MALGVFRHIKDGKLSQGAESRSSNPMLLEKLEPRILLSADSLLAVAAPDPLADSMQPMVQHAELLHASEHQPPTAEREIDHELALSSDGIDLLEPILTLTVDDSNVVDGGDLSVVPDDSDGNIDNETNATEVVHVAVEEPTTNSPAVPVEDGNISIYTADDADPSAEYAASIEIRGPPAQAQAQAAYRNQIVFVDSTLEHDFQPKNAETSGVEVVVLDAGQDGIQQIAQSLSGLTNISAIHIISHGAPGQITIGTGVLDSASADDYSDAFHIWGEALAQDGDILLYGCAVAQTDAGVSLIDRIAALTFADVAASTDDTGAAKLGGDWTLEQTTGPIEAVLPFAGPALSDFGGILADQWNEQQKLTASDAAAGDNLGFSVSISGGTAVAGAQGDGEGVWTKSGAAYVFTLSADTWVQQQKISDPDPGSDAFFGRSVSIDGDTIVVGAPGVSVGGYEKAGSAYVFSFDGGTWHLQQKLSNPDPGASDYFGHAVSVSGDTIIVGAYYDDGAWADAGSAYIFTRVGGTWGLPQRLDNPEPGPFDRFGVSVAIEGDTAMVGAEEDDRGDYNSGSAYIFTRSGSIWSESQKLSNPDPTKNGRFGCSVSLHGDTAVVGARGNEVNGHVWAGSAYMFRRDGSAWNRQQTLANPDPLAYDNFGVSVALSGDTVMVGASGDDSGAADSGSMYVFMLNGDTWIQHQKLNNPDPSAYDNFGISASLSGKVGLIGDSTDDDHGSSSGSAYVFVSCRTELKLDSGNLVVEDISTTNTNDQKTLSTDGTNVTITDPDVWLGTTISGSTGNATHTLSVPLSAFAGGIIVNALGGDDSLIIDFSSGIFDRAITYNGGTQYTSPNGDSLSLTGGSFTDTMYTFTNESEGSVALDGLMITYTGLEPITSSVDAEIVTLSYSGASETITITDAGGGQTTVASTAGETITFNNPSTTLTINSGAGSDIINVEGLGDGFAASLVIDGQGGTDTVNFQTSATHTGGGDLAVSADTINVNAPVATHGGDAGFSAAQGIAFNEPVTTAGGALDLDADSDSDGSGNLSVTAATMDVFSDQQTLTAFNAPRSDDFGHSVAISGDTAVVGARFDDYAALTDSGSVFVFVRSGSTWIQQQKLSNPEPGIDDMFGEAVAIDGDTIIVGSRMDNDGAYIDCGSAYVFTRAHGNWNLQQKLCNPEPAEGDWFGCAVSIDDNTAIVGAYYDDFGVWTDPGSAYVFTRTDNVWSLQKKLGNPEPGSFDRFGVSVSIDGDTAMVGATEDDDDGYYNSGSAYVYRRVGSVWTEPQKLSNPNPARLGRFGSSVSLSGDTAIVGAYGDEVDGYVGAGSAYIFRLHAGTWFQQQKLSNPDPATYDSFGLSVSVSGDKAIVGVYGDDEGALGSGSAYIYTLSNGILSQQQKLSNPQPDQYEYFGYSVALSGAVAIVGAPHDNEDLGAAYIVTSGPVITTGGGELTALADEIHVGAGISTRGGDASLSATNGITLNEPMTTEGGSVILDADSDANGTGTFKIAAAIMDAFDQQQKLEASDAAGYDLFGYSVSISGDTAIVGAHYDDDDGSNSGSAYVFSRSDGTWTQQQKLTAADATAGDLFGFSVSISGYAAIVGAPFADSGAPSSGAAYLFTWRDDTWIQQQKLTASDPSQDDRFGMSVSISGRTAIVGAHHDDDAGSESGSAYVFVRNDSVWTQQQKLTAFDSALHDNFGVSVSISGNTVLVGAFQDDDAGSASGSAYVFTRNDNIWSQQQKLTAFDAAAGDNFGVAVSISGNVAVVGAYQDDDGGSDSGSAYVFVRLGSIWIQQQKLTASDAAPNDWFGRSISISGDLVLVGAYRNDGGGSDSGSTYVFSCSGSMWTQQYKLIASDAATGDYFGHSVGISGDTAIVGAYHNDESGTASGSVYVFEYSAGTNGGSVSTGDGSVTISAAKVDLTGSIASMNSLKIQPSIASSSIGIGGGTGQLNLTDMELESLQDGFANVIIGNTVTGTGSIDIDTASFLDPVLIAGGTIHDHGGTDITGPLVSLDGDVSPGQSLGVLNVDGDYVFANNGTFTVEIGGTSPGTANSNHDQVDVVGRVTIGENVTLNPMAWNSFVPSLGDTFTIINNDGVDPVTCTFSGLAEGAIISNFLGSGLNATISYTDGVDNNDVVLSVTGATVSVSTTSVTEDDPARLDYIFTRAGSTRGNLTVSFSLSGSVDDTTDFDIDGTGVTYDIGSHTGTITILDGASTAVVTIDPSTDSTVESNEDIVLTVSAGAGYNVGSSDSASVVINNDDSAALLINDVSITEGTGAGNTQLSFIVSLDTGVEGGFQVAFSSALGTAAASDLSMSTVSPLTFVGIASETQTIDVDITRDTIVEDNETFTITLGDVTGTTPVQDAEITTGDSGTGTIDNDDVATISINDVSLAEDNSATTAFSFTVSIDNPASYDITVVANTNPANPVTATGGGIDYADVVNQMLTLAAGDTSTAMVVDATGELFVELDETFEVNLADASFNGVTDATRAVIGDAQGIGTIQNDDSAMVNLSGGSANEADGSVDFTVELTNPVDVAASVQFGTLLSGTATAGDDFTAINNQQVTFAANQTSQTVSVTIHDDLFAEYDETIAGQIGALNDGGRDVLLGSTTASAMIVNDDQATIVVSLDGSDLKIEDVAGLADNVILRRDQANERWIVGDTANLVLSEVPNSVPIDPYTVAVPFAEVGGAQILVQLNADADGLTLDFSDSEFTRSINYDGGDPNTGPGDSLILAGGSFDDVAFNFTDASGGSVDLDGSVITYTGLEPIISTITATNVTLNYGSANDWITITDPVAGQTTVDSDQAETITFTDPTGTLTINGGTGDDITDVDLASTHSANVAIDGQGDSDTINLNTALDIDGGKGLSCTAERINIGSGTIDTEGDQIYNGSVVLGADTTLTGASVTFASTVDSGVADLSGYSNLVGYWKFDEGVGTSAGDSSSTSQNGTLAGSNAPLPQWAQGLSGSALQFEGGGDVADRYANYVDLGIHNSPETSALRPHYLLILGKDACRC